MAYVIIESKEFPEIINRLNQGKLTGDDSRLITLLLQRAHRVSDTQSALGRFSVDQLPVGLDLVK